MQEQELSLQNFRIVHLKVDLSVDENESSPVSLSINCRHYTFHEDDFKKLAHEEYTDCRECQLLKQEISIFQNNLLITGNLLSPALSKNKEDEEKISLLQKEVEMRKKDQRLLRKRLEDLREIVGIISKIITRFQLEGKDDQFIIKEMQKIWEFYLQEQEKLQNKLGIKKIKKAKSSILSKMGEANFFIFLVGYLVGFCTPFFHAFFYLFRLDRKKKKPKSSKTLSLDSSPNN